MSMSKSLILEASIQTVSCQAVEGFLCFLPVVCLCMCVAVCESKYRETECVFCGDVYDVDRVHMPASNYIHNVIWSVYLLSATPAKRLAIDFRIQVPGHHGSSLAMAAR